MWLGHGRVRYLCSEVAQIHPVICRYHVGTFSFEEAIFGVNYDLEFRPVLSCHTLSLCGQIGDGFLQLARNIISRLSVTAIA